MADSLFTSFAESETTNQWKNYMKCDRSWFPVAESVFTLFLHCRSQNIKLSQLKIKIKKAQQ